MINKTSQKIIEARIESATDWKHGDGDGYNSQQVV